MKFYTYFRSTAAYRVRIALNLKGVAYEPVYVHLTRDGGEQKSAKFRTLNPQGLVPVLEEGGDVIAQSLAIIEYLDTKYPEPPLLPAAPAERARVQSFALAIVCDVHPLNNLRVLQYLRNELGLDDGQVNAWYGHWIAEAFRGLESIAAASADGPFCFGDTVTLADVCLVPQIFNARRFGCDMSPYPRLTAIDAALTKLEAFASAAPAAQADAE